MGGEGMTRRFLPALDQTLQPPAPNGDRSWADHDGGLGVLAKYSAALVVSHAEVPAERLKSVPSPWARLFLFEQALFNRRHPAHQQITAEWRGMLGAIGLAPHLGLTVAARPIDLSQASGILSTLRAMAPRDDEALWNRIALIQLDGATVGGTSARTLVFTGIRAISGGRVPFQENGRLTDPTGHYSGRRDKTSLALLSEWLTATVSALGDGPGLSKLKALVGNVPGGMAAQVGGTGAVSRAELLLQVLRDWEAETREASQSVGRPGAKVAKDLRASAIGDAFPANHPANSAFQLLKQIVPADDLAPENDLQVHGSSKVVQLGRGGLLLKNGHPFTGDVALPRGMSRGVRNGQFTLPTDSKVVHATLPDLGELFERKLIPIRDVATSQLHALNVDGVAYLYPFKLEILDYISATELESWTRTTGERATGINVRLEIPLGAGLHLLHEKSFEAGDVLDQDAVTAPLVSAWPNFQAAWWKHYFYVERQPANGGLQLKPRSSDGVATATYGDEGLRWFKLDRPPQAWVGTFSAFSGILPSRQPSVVSRTDEKWDVSIDFGSTHTRVFRSVIGATGSDTAREVTLTPRSVSLVGSDTSLPYEFFVSPQMVRGPSVEAPSLIWLPLDRTLDSEQAAGWLPAEGVVFWAPIEDAPTTTGLRGNLKWHRDDAHERAAFHSYASQLYFMIAAEAAAAGGEVRSLITAFPSVLPRQLRTRHRAEWNELQHKYGVTVKQPRSESDALAAYLVGAHSAPIQANLIAVDVGGSTSDLTFWRGGRKVGSDSIRLAGDILSRLVALDSTARDAFTTALQRPPFNRRGVPWNDDASKNGMLLNSILRTISNDPKLSTGTVVLAETLYGGPNSPGERVLAHLGYLFATLGFLLGTMVRRDREAVSPGARYDIRFAGKGSEFLRWLDALAPGASKTIPEVFFRAGLGQGAAGAEVEISLPTAEVKQEVGRGLLLRAVGDETSDSNRSTFVGEAGLTIAGRPLRWDEPLDFDTLRAIEVPSTPIEVEALTTLNAFVGTFETDATTKQVARALGISPKILTRQFRDRVHTSLFGPHSAWNATRQAGNAGQEGSALLEPFFVTEAKTLLEHATGNPNLFAS
jgi:hypothetical protein